MNAGSAKPALLRNLALHERVIALHRLPVDACNELGFTGCAHKRLPFTIREETKTAQGMDQFVPDNLTKLGLVFLLRHRRIIDVHRQGNDALAVAATALVTLDKLGVVGHQEFRRKNTLGNQIDITGRNDPGYELPHGISRLRPLGLIFRRERIAILFM